MGLLLRVALMVIGLFGVSFTLVSLGVPTGLAELIAVGVVFVSVVYYYTTVLDDGTL